jgi:hypothetical protein
VLEFGVITLALLGAYVVLHVWMPRHARGPTEEAGRGTRRG